MLARARCAHRLVVVVVVVAADAVADLLQRHLGAQLRISRAFVGKLRIELGSPIAISLLNVEFTVVVATGDAATDGAATPRNSAAHSSQPSPQPDFNLAEFCQTMLGKALCNASLCVVSGHRTLPLFQCQAMFFFFSPGKCRV